MRTLQELEDVYAFVQATGRPSSIALTKPLSETDAQISSRLLGPAFMLPTESWPTRNGKALTCILQVRTDELPVVPEALKGIAFLSLFTDVEGGFVSSSGWVIRHYASLQQLAPREPQHQPPKAKRWTPLHIEWVEHLDVLHPWSEVAEEVLPASWLPVYDKMTSVPYDSIPRSFRVQKKLPTTGGGEAALHPQYHARRTKIGGFPTYKQWEKGHSHPKQFVFQIFYDLGYRRDGYDLSDCAITYVGLDADGTWCVETQSS